MLISARAEEGIVSGILYDCIKLLHLLNFKFKNGRKAFITIVCRCRFVGVLQLKMLTALMLLAATRNTIIQLFIW